ncbi:putative mitochondrial hypothetical protein [Leptomonas pyrrhocoris]|uniref:Uncharacterized protein n=1 Tax=Leptomonas pyrrhocoris TaxID=157538 RepID=A0A0N0DTY5_LEPPY|nr:putative mitochondrial hypothetical protein [Leptomonas pyrrhocoris]KPA78142.1 putative mitochondrial hypothetical protein [Leptomonas pyrrhocoris]|eukprot:XP_015656581.1 putative mitochondrial hypothetical protein [Leptomonas pyrrhocoris]
MLSNTKGYSRFSRSLGYHRDDLATLGRICLAWKRTGKCKAYNKEQEVRHTLAAAKEAELRKSATALYTTQMDLAADLSGVEGDATLLQGMATAQAGFSTDPAKKEEMIDRLVAVLKQEPAYLNWSLDAAVAEKMVELHIAPCRFTHRGELATSLKRSRGAQDREDVRVAQQQHEEQQTSLKSVNVEGAAEGEQRGAAGGVANGDVTANRPSTQAASSSPTRSGSAMTLMERMQEEKWAEQRHRIFQTLTPLQRCVVCLLWQRSYQVEQGVVCDVRLTLERRLTDVYDRTGRVVVKGVVVAERHRTTEEEKGAETANGDEDDPLDAYLSSSEFEELVECESKRVVTRVVFRPDYGMVDLSALPLLVAHLSSVPECGVVLARTLTYFTGSALAPRQGGQAESGSGGGVVATDDRPAPADFHGLLFPTRQPIAEKEVDLGGAGRANEVVEAVEWALQLYQREGQLHAEKRAVWEPPMGSATWSASAAQAATTTHGTPSPSPSCSSLTPQQQQPHVSALFRHQRIRLHGLTLRHCKITSADALVSALHKRNLELFMYALDLSDNRLWSLRFLLVLRTHFAERLLRLSLKNNPITRKPEYQEQVRRSLPQLTSLDGEPIRRPPLRLPKPLPSSCTRSTAEGSPPSREVNTQSSVEQRRDEREGVGEEDVQASVLDCVGRLLYIWETRRIPHINRELHARDQSGDVSLPEEEEEEWNEDNFPHRYLHPAATFSVAVAPGLNFFDAATMREARSVELDPTYTGMRLSAVDLRDARVFDVAMKNSSRNLLAGRPALQRFGKGAENCYLAYQFTLYPERMEVEHHVTDAVVSVARVADVDVQAAAATAAATATSPKSSTKKTRKHTPKTDAPQQQQQQPSSTAARFGARARGAALTQHIVTLHGTMTWRLPSMKAGECIRACYTRVLLLTKKVLPAQNRVWERLRSPPYVLVNDAVFLYQAPVSPSVTTAPSAIFRANTPARLSRLVVEFGLEACGDGAALVRDVVERSTSPAAEYAALQALVLGVLGPRVTAAAAAEEEGEGKGERSAAAADTVPSSSTAGTLEGEDAAALQLARTAAAQLAPVLAAHVRATAVSATPASSSTAARSYVIFSVLEGAHAAEDALGNVVGGNEPPQQQQHTKKEGRAVKTHNEDKAAVAHSSAGEQQENTQNIIKAWASGLHVITRSLLRDVTSITNACYTHL